MVPTVVVEEDLGSAHSPHTCVDEVEKPEVVDELQSAQ